MKQLEQEFWKLVNQCRRLKNNRLLAIKKWNVPEIDRLDKLIEENNQKSDLIIEKMKQLAA